MADSASDERLPWRRLGPPSGQDRRWRSTASSTADWDSELAAQIEARYPRLGSLRARVIYSSVNDVAEVVANDRRYALKLYRPGVRDADERHWEAGLQAHLIAAGVEAMPLVEGTSGLVEKLLVEGVERPAVLSEWAPGEKPVPSAETYRRLGQLAGAVHAAAETYRPPWSRAPEDMNTEVWDQLERLRSPLEAVGRFDEAQKLAGRIDRFLSGQPLERGIGHNDLTLDNVHLDGEVMYVFDFDCAGEHWRAFEAQGVFHASILTGEPRWENWLAGYTSVRPLSAADQAAVPWFVLMFGFENTAWRLGLTKASVGRTLRQEDLARVVDDWSAWADTHCRDR